MLNNKREELALQLFREGYNCAQAVLLAFEDCINIDFETAASISAPFGGGLARQREVCGAVSGMSMAFGLLSPFGGSDKKEAKVKNYAEVKLMCEEFKAIHSSIVCHELLTKKSEPLQNSREYLALTPCERCVEDATRIVAEKFKLNESR